MPWTKIHSKNLQRAITPKIVGPELWFSYIALLLNVIYLCMNFEVMLWTRFCDTCMVEQTDGWTDGRTVTVTPVYPPPPKKKKKKTLFVRV